MKLLVSDAISEVIINVKVSIMKPLSLQSSNSLSQAMAYEIIADLPQYVVVYGSFATLLGKVMTYQSLQADELWLKTSNEIHLA